ncbi:MAG TPA: dihydrolipoyl dehydrogenase [Polyangiaceae bacterium LLY-WYZ-14_1]|jgi:dihydrolipoamide dehydrogenase|nr:dihydrolipoyl dehydrogenase [Polyangiaceae bacterium LLY-WYZ-14_1]
MAHKTYDAIVIGAGPGGYVAAIRLGQLGQSVLCVDKEYLGGVCLNWGCIPSKALISAATLAHKVQHSEAMGITVDKVHVDVPKMQAWKEGIVKKLTTGVGQLIKGNGGESLIGDARITGPKTVEVTAKGETNTFEATKGIIVATGASTITIPGFEPDGKTVITAREAVSLQEAPKKMVLIGGGVIGLELGMVYQKLGTEVTVVELMDQLLPGVDKDVVRVVQKHLEQMGGKVLLKAKAKSLDVKRGKAKVVVEHEGKEVSLDGDKVLVAVGFRPNSAGLGLEELGVKLDERGHILVDDTFQTNVPGVYAIGDVTGAPYLAHKASKEGEIAAEVIAGHKAARDWRAMPAAIFTDPEVATVGLTETQAKAQGREVKVGKFPYGASGRAMAVFETDGFVKVIVDANDHQVLGMTMVGPEASELIAEGALAMEMCAYAEDVGLTIHTHPTLAEATMEAFKGALGEAVHVMNRR